MSMQNTQLGKPFAFPKTYDPIVLYPIARTLSRDKWNLKTALPFQGYDLWNDYEFSWLGPRGKPEVRIIQVSVPATSANLVESKSLKLYFNSFYQAQYNNEAEIKAIIVEDLSKVVGTEVEISFFDVENKRMQPQFHPGILLDTLDVSIAHYQVSPSLLEHAGKEVRSETLVTHLFRSLCPVTAHPDWATVVIQYEGQTIDHAGLLKYLISYREHQGFHEACVEGIFMDIQKRLSPLKLRVEGYFLRRGGLDINPIRANYPISDEFKRWMRQ